ncbi:MAG: hypothetical protein AAGF90_22550, partial [Pseudomonadota bacterium]
MAEAPVAATDRSMAAFFARGWTRFPFEPAVADWAAHADAVAKSVERAPAPGMMRCGGTWHVGVDALGADAEGRVSGGPPLSGAALAAARSLIGAPSALDAGQASAFFEGYPRRGDEEDEAAFRYRLKRDAAHLDGLHRIMPGRRRMLKERHGFILGLPLNEAPAGAAPLVVWEGSHEVMRAALREAFGDAPPETWPEIDVTDAYQAARRRCFETLRRVEVPARPGEAYLIHRLALHGVAPWAAEAG